MIFNVKYVREESARYCRGMRRKRFQAGKSNPCCWSRLFHANVLNFYNNLAFANKPTYSQLFFTTHIDDKFTYKSCLITWYPD